MIVRKMHPQEFDVTVNLFGYYRDEAIESIPQIADEYDENSVIETIKEFSIQWNHCWFNAYDAQRPVGFIAGFITSKPWNKEIISGDIYFLYLLKSHRNLDNLKKLMNEFEDWARLCGATQITGGDIGIDIPRSKTIYEHFGFREMLLMSKEL